MELKLLSANIKNFQSISAKQVDFMGKSAIIIGSNDKGKSAFLRAIFAPLGKQFVPLKPIKEGETRGEVTLTIGGKEKTYEVTMIFSAEHQKGRLTVTDSESGKIPQASAKQVLDSLIGMVGFDVFSFINMGMTPSGQVSKEGCVKQIELIKGILPADTLTKLDALDAEKESLSVQQKVKKDKIKELRASLENHGFSTEELTKYKSVVDTAPIQKEFETLSQDLVKYQKAEEFVSGWPENKKSKEDKIKSLEEQITSLKEEIKKGDDGFKACQTVTAKAKPSIEAVQKKLNEANLHNQKHESLEKLKVKQKDLREIEEAVKDYPEKFKKIAEDRRRAFASGEFPIPGLTFEEDQLFWKGKPFNEDHVPASHLTVIGARISMLLNPTFKLIVVRNGNLLDDVTMKHFLELCENEGYQVLIEYVDATGEKDLTIEFVEKEVE